MIFDINSSKTKREYIPAEKLNICELKNCILKEGQIESRKGFVSSQKDVVLKQYGFAEGDKKLHITENFLFINGQYGRVVADVLDNLMGTVTYSLFFLTADGKKHSLGYIEFASNGETAGYPDSFTIFSGAKTIGSGVYFMARQRYLDGRADFVSIRELSEDLGLWILLPESEIYAPTLLANGRGESYYFATVGEKDLKLPEPILPEAKNMLTPRFKALYTTDNTSSAFSLPYAEIDNSAVSAELDIRGAKFSFFIAAGSVESEPVTVEGQQVTMHIDRIAGRVRFKSGNNANWAPAFTGEYNNLVFIAAKTDEQSRVLMAAATACKKVEGCVPAGKNEVTIFYGNRLKPSIIAVNSPSSPLYISEKAVYSLGNPEKGVLHISDMGGKIFAFKEGKAFVGEIKTAQKTVDGGKEFFESSVTFKGSTEISTCPKAATVRETSSGIIFQSEDNSVWEITFRGQNSILAERIAQNTPAADFAITLEDKYLLIKDKTATVYWKNGGEYLCSKWTLPARAVGGISYLERSAVFFEYKDDLVYIIYASSCRGEEDVFFVSEFLLDRAPVSASVLTDLTDKEKKAKRLYKISVEAEGKSVNLRLWAEGKKSAERRAGVKNSFADFYVGAAAKSILAEISFEGQGVISGIITDYKDISKK